ncbi:MAG TPA: hypothetical protein VFQ82_13630 [Stellaceae bacterium]|jgi:hypothetical protein|nr:hypothetical protein [Stellaceae bacterium]
MHGYSDLVKDGLGFVATILIAVPWLRDYSARRLRSEIEALPVGGRLRAATRRLQARLDGWIDSPKQSDLLIMATGFILLALSFLISLFASLAGA